MLEHALEVQLPFLQVLRPGFQFVPITVGASNFDALSALGDAIGNLLADLFEPALAIASSDMNHYESDEATRGEGPPAIDQVAGSIRPWPVRRGDDKQHQHVRLRPCDYHADGGRKMEATKAETHPLRDLGRHFR